MNKIFVITSSVVIIILIFAIGYLLLETNRPIREPSGQARKITISVLDASSNQPINNAQVKLDGLTEGIPEDSTPSPEFGKEKTKDGVAIFYVPTYMLDVVFAFGVNVTADNYIGEYQTFDKGKREFTIRLINKQEAVVNSEKLAVEYAKKNEWVAYWIEKHPGFNPNDPKNYQVSIESPFWFVTFRDSIDRRFHNMTIECSTYWKTPDDIRCNIMAKVNAVDGEVIQLKPDIADTKWAD